MAAAEREWWEEPGCSAGLTDALRRLHRGRTGRATDEERPPPSVFPSTPASRQAMRITREHRRRYKA